MPVCDAKSLSKPPLPCPWAERFTVKIGTGALKVAWMVVLLLTVTSKGELEEVPPLKPAKVPLPTVAVRVGVEPLT